MKDGLKLLITLVTCFLFHYANADDATWTGMINSRWHEGGNWQDGIVPGAYDNVTIPQYPGGGKFPEISNETGIAEAYSFIIESGATVTHTGGALYINAEWNNNGVYNASSGSAVTFYGSGYIGGTSQTIFSVLATSAGAAMTLSTNIAVTNLVLGAGSSLVLSNRNLKIIGSFTTNGGKINATSGKIEMAGTISQRIPANAFFLNVVKSVVIANEDFVSLEGLLRITTSIGFGNVNNSTFYTNGYLTLASSSSSTANLLDITNSGINVGNRVDGDVTVERYAQGKRAFRFLTAPVNSSLSIRANWMENTNNTSIYQNSNPVPNYGTHITGTGGSANGFDPSQTNNPSLFTFNNSSQKWIPAPNTNAVFRVGTPFRIMVRGNRNTDLNNNEATPSATVLRAKGSLVTGAVKIDTIGGNGDFPVLSPIPNRFNLVANPYASAIDWSLLSTTDISSTIYIYDPTVSGSKAAGAYVAYNSIFQTNSLATSLINNHIQSGQGFFVYTTGPNPSLTIKENHKSSVFRPVFRQQVFPTISLEVLLPGQGASKVVADGAKIFFSDEFCSAIGPEDSYKFTNPDENIAIVEGTTALSIEGRRKTVKGTDSVFLKMWQMTLKEYMLSITIDNFNPGNEAGLWDKFLNKLIPLVHGENLIPIDYTLDPDSKAPERFVIVLRSARTLPVELTKIKAYEKNKGVEVEWTAMDESNVSLYEVEKSSDAITFTRIGVVTRSGVGLSNDYSFLDPNITAGDSYYRIRSVEKSGDAKYSEVVRIQHSNQKSTAFICNNPIKDNVVRIQLNDLEAGCYVLRLVDMAGNEIYAGKVAYQSGRIIHEIRLKSYLAAGIYQLQIVNGPFVKNLQVLKQ